MRRRQERQKFLWLRGVAAAIGQLEIIEWVAIVWQGRVAAVAKPRIFTKSKIHAALRGHGAYRKERLCPPCHNFIIIKAIQSLVLCLHVWQAGHGLIERIELTLVRSTVLNGLTPEIGHTRQINAGRILCLCSDCFWRRVHALRRRANAFLLSVRKCRGIRRNLYKANLAYLLAGRKSIRRGRGEANTLRALDWIGYTRVFLTETNLIFLYRIIETAHM